MKYIYILFIIFSLGCNRNYCAIKRESQFTSQELEILSNNCNYIYETFKTKFKPIKKTKEWADSFEFVYMFDRKRVFLLNFTDCFNGRSKSEIIELLGTPSIICTEEHCLYLFTYIFDDKKSYFKLNFSFKKEKLTGIGLIVSKKKQ